MGWGVGGQDVDWPTYSHLAREKYGAVNSSVRRLHDLPDGALVWLRDTRGAYYLAQVTGPWMYASGTDAERHDIHNVRPASIVACGVESLVPGKVLNSFIPNRTLQAIRDDPARRGSAAQYSQLTGQPSLWKPTYEELLTSFLSASDLEDLVAAYLQQHEGYMVLPATRRRDTPAYEYVLVHPDGHQAVVQVKGGWSVVPRDAGSLPTELVEHVYVFSPTESYGPDPAPNVETIQSRDLLAFMHSPQSCLPPMVKYWTRLAADA
jgi:hypothetical protein